MFTFGTFAKTRGKRDRQTNATHPYSQSTPLGILVEDGVLCWEARLHRSVAVPASPHIPMPNGTRVPDGSLDSSTFNEESLLYAINKTLASAKTEATLDGEGPNTRFDLSETLDDLGDMPNGTRVPDGSLDSSTFNEESLLYAINKESLLYAIIRTFICHQQTLTSANAEATLDGGGSNTRLDLSETLDDLDDEAPVCVVLRFLVVTGPIVLPLGIWGCLTLGAQAFQQALKQQFGRNTTTPFESFEASAVIQSLLSRCTGINEWLSCRPMPNGSSTHCHSFQHHKFPRRQPLAAMP
jgi:hypothetical protein